jgi:hypothetical protein
MIDAVDGATAHSNHPPVFHRDIASAAIAAQRASRLHPTINVVLTEAISQLLINTHRPLLASGKRRPGAPDVADPVHHNNALFRSDL